MFPAWNGEGQPLLKVGMKEKNLSKREKNGNFFEKFEDHCKRTEF